jgi:hypothetical protein
MRFSITRLLSTTLLSTTLLSSALVAIMSSEAIANHFTSPPPSPPSKPQYTSPWFIVESQSRTRFFASNPLIPQRTSDGNLFVSSVFALFTPDGAMSGSYTQVNCGTLTYRNLTPWFTKARDNSESWSAPENYSWQYFTPGSALEMVGKSICEKAAGNLGIVWTWN